MGAPKTYRILIVEDNPVVRDLCQHALKKLKTEEDINDEFELVEVADGATAWDRIQEMDIDLLVTDLYVPILGGLDVIERVRESDKATLKILAISASLQDARVKSLDAGADMFLQKPLRMIELLDAVRALLRL